MSTISNRSLWHRASPPSAGIYFFNIMKIPGRRQWLVSASLLLILNKFYTLFWCFNNWTWTRKFLLGQYADHYYTLASEPATTSRLYVNFRSREFYLKSMWISLDCIICIQIVVCFEKKISCEVTPSTLTRAFMSLNASMLVVIAGMSAFYNRVIRSH